MKAIGFIETYGQVPAIESADAMLKAAEVQLVSRTFVKAGIVNITVTGDVAAVKASIDAGVASVNKMGGMIVSTHVIPRPDPSIKGILGGTIINDPEEKESIQANVQKKSTQSSTSKKKSIQTSKADETTTQSLSSDKKPTKK